MAIPMPGRWWRRRLRADRSRWWGAVPTDAPAPDGRDIQVPLLDRTIELWPLNSSASATVRRRPAPAFGHWYLGRLLSVHEVIQRHGVAAAARLLTRQQISDAIAACGYFGVPELGTALAGLRRAALSAESARVFDAEYRRRFCLTDVVVAAIRSKIAATPDEFAA